MRITHIAPTAFGAEGILGGGERYPLELARAVARELPCELVTFGARPGVVVEPGGLRVRTLRTFARVGGHPAHPLASSLPSALRAAELVHAHQLKAAPTRVSAVLAAVRRQPLVVTDHGLQGGDWRGVLPRLVARFLTVSEHSAEVLDLPPDKVRVVYGGVDTDRFRPDPQKDREGVLFVGRITPHKGVDRLIEALPPGVRLTVVGGAGHDPRLPERDYPRLLRRLAEDKEVRFLGPVGDAELARCYREAVVVVIPSVNRTCYDRPVLVSELLCLVALEAMASATPVLASRIGGLPEVVIDGATGVLVEPGDVAALGESLRELLTAPGLARSLGEAGREHVSERFTWSACAARCLAAYADLSGAW
ncbi:MAG: glycosyltransferase family 4 protein [Solirubrobacteraceae bacterium]